MRMSQCNQCHGSDEPGGLAAADLSVDSLLTGTYIHDGDRVRITYQLIDVKTEKILGRDIIDLKYENLFAVQDAVTQQIIKGYRWIFPLQNRHR